MKLHLFSLLTAFSIFGTAWTSFAADPKDWRITQPVWTETHEQLFGEFIVRLGEAVEARKCSRVDTCLKSDVNPYYSTDPVGLKYYADCADLPYYLRGYFAWKNGLPFSMVNQVKPVEGPVGPLKPSKDVRYSPHGNYALSRFEALVKVQPDLTNVYPNAVRVLNYTIPGLTFSATYRMMGTDDTGLMSDFYPARLDRTGIRPGTVIYDPNGHVAIVYRVADDGRVYYIDAHPDNSLTMGMFSPKFVRSAPGQGAGFKNFRPLALVDAVPDLAGDGWAGGKIVPAFNHQVHNMGIEQFYGTNPDPGGDWAKGKFSILGRNVNFYDYVRMKLTVGELHIDPIEDMNHIVDDICISVKDRVASVESARAEGIYLKPHPLKLPENIYGTQGEWETYATPSRDARLKVAFVDLLANTVSNIERYKNKDSVIRYEGTNLAGDLLNIYLEKSQTCQITYTTTDNRAVTLNLEEVRQRLFNMSFDPYHCIELRWGATNPEELASCADDANKRAWYENEKYLRNQPERRFDVRMDYTLEELANPIPGVGLETAPDIDVLSYLRWQIDWM